MSEDLAHDAHLRAALRHAPDHALSPPSGLTQSILSAARQAHRPLPANPAPPPMRMRVAGAPSLRDWTHRLLAPRWAGAWATGLVASLGLGLWLDLGPEPVVEPPANGAATDTEPKDKTAAPVKVAPAAPSAVLADAGVAVTARAPEAAGTVRAQAATARAQPNAERVAGARTRAAAPHPEPAREQAALAEGAVRGSQRAAADASQAKPSGDNPAVQMATAAPAAAPPPETAQDKAETTTRVAESSVRLDAMRRAESLRLQPASPQALLSRAQSESAAGTARWTWSAPGRPTITPFDADAQAWLSHVLSAAQGRWQDSAEHAAGGGDAVEVRWWRDGWPSATLRIESGGVRWIEPGGRSLYAPLEAATVQRLRSY